MQSVLVLLKPETINASLLFSSHMPQGDQHLQILQPLNSATEEPDDVESKHPMLQTNADTISADGSSSVPSRRGPGGPGGISKYEDWFPTPLEGAKQCTVRAEMTFIGRGSAAPFKRSTPAVRRRKNHRERSSSFRWRVRRRDRGLPPPHKDDPIGIDDSSSVDLDADPIDDSLEPESAVPVKEEPRDSKTTMQKLLEAQQQVEILQKEQEYQEKTARGFVKLTTDEKYFYFNTEVYNDDFTLKSPEDRKAIYREQYKHAPLASLEAQYAAVTNGKTIAFYPDATKTEDQQCMQVMVIPR